MQLFKLNSSFLPSTSVTDFKSIIWTERFLEAGDFKITAEDDISIINNLPLGTLISHTDTHEVMIVETHEIERDKDKKLIVTVSGRGFETFLENRVTEGSDLALENGSGVVNNEILSSMAASTAAVYIMRRKIETGYVINVYDAITNVAVSNTVSPLDAAMTHAIKRGDIYSNVLDLLKIAKAGIKTVRPNGAQTTLNIITHSGSDLSATVAFYSQYEDLEDAKYLNSIKGYKNHARVSGKIATRLYRDRAIGTIQSGLNRRIIYEEASDLTAAYTATPNDGDAISARGQSAVDANKKISIFQAKISETAKPKFKLDYNVGDLVTVYGEFKTVEKMRVSEHILTVDEYGIRGYPALSSID